MKIYKFNENTHELLVELDARPDPLTPGRYLIPANATKIKPPTTGENETACFIEGDWVVKEDHRGQTVYSKADGEEMVIKSLGAVPELYTLTPRPDEYYDFDEQTGEWQENLSRKMDELVVSKAMAINEQRTTAINAGVSWNNHNWDSDDDSRNNLAGAVAGFNAGVPVPEGFSWRTSDNIDVPMTMPDLVALSGAMLVHVNTQYQMSWTLKNNVAAIAEDEGKSLQQRINEIAAITWPGQ